MSTTLIPLLMIGLFAAILVLVIWAAAKQSRRAMENLRQTAESLGLQYTAKPPTAGIFYADARASGVIRGKQVELFPFATGSGKSRIQWSAVSAAVPAGGSLTFHLRRQGLGTKFMELFGAKEIQVGDAAFDAAWFIQTNQPEFLREALLPELRAKISSLAHEFGPQPQGMEFKLEQGRVRYAEIGSFSTSAVCKRCARAAEIVCDLADVAEVFAGQAPGP